MITIGLTGGIASGKSLVARMLRDLGCTVIDTDVIAREVVAPGTDGQQAVVAEFGPQVLTENGQLDRERLADIIFADAGRRAVLNSILHPLIMKKAREQAAAAEAVNPDAIVVVDVPLLIECGIENDFDAVVVVWTTRDQQIARLMARDGLNEEAARQRLAAQLPLDQKRAGATFVIENAAGREKTEAQVRELFARLCKAGKGRGEKPE
jgi:dephospho-CoA kinase